MRQNFGKKNEIFENKIFVDKYDLIYWINGLALLMNAMTWYIEYFMCMNSVSGLCLCLRDTALKLTRHMNNVDG